MLYTLLNDGWSYRHLDTDEDFRSVRIPHDAMISEQRSMESAGGTNTGWFLGYDYEYLRELTIDSKDLDDHFELEFEGVYHNSEVYLNDRKLSFRPYGYTNFYVDLTGLLREGKNIIRVIARNKDQPNSRWYSGAGIYRNVRLWSAKGDYIIQNGLTVTTKDIANRKINVNIKTTGIGNLEYLVSDMQGRVLYSQKTQVNDKNISDGIYSTDVELILDNALLWSLDEPNLYNLSVIFGSDKAESTFGIRTIEYGNEGFLLNSKRVIIRGACIHHDNGILGAAADPDAILRKVKILRDNGYNALRSAHNPCSKTLLDVCDRLGVLVMDEYIDHWYIHKTQFDYVDYFMDYYKKDLYDMVQKDKNHPCVILYSTGNEVSETAQKKGIALTKEMTDYIHSLDDTRPVTCGVNIFFNFLSSIGFGVYSDKNAAKEAKKAEKRKFSVQTEKKPKAVGSQFFNNMAGLFGADFMKTGASLKACDLKTRDAFSAMDIAGYNYGIKRYKKDLKKYTDRLILGSETFCSDAYKYYEMVKSNPRLVGDFVWSGMDYIGEVGVGAWEYKDYAPSFDHGAGWLTAGSGRIDLTGKTLGESLYTQVAFDLKKGPFIAVRPVCFSNKKHSPSAWKMTDAMPSWSYNGLGGTKAIVEVYARAYKVELFINDKKAGSKILKKDCKAIFKCIYEDGEIVAKSYDKESVLIGVDKLVTAAEETKITAQSESKNVEKGHLAFIRFKYTDINGILKPMERGTFTLGITGGTLEGFGNGCSYNERGYCTNKSDTYYGECFAAVRASKDVSEIIVTVTDGKLRETVEIGVI